MLLINFQTGSLVRTEGIITSLVFDHALRIRLKAATSDKKDAPTTDAAAGDSPNPDAKSTSSPDSGSTASSDEADDDTTVHSRSPTAASTSTSTTVVTPAKAADDKKKDEKESKEETDSKSKGSNLIGKINNLITSDLENITRGRDFLFLGKKSREERLDSRR